MTPAPSSTPLVNSLQERQPTYTHLISSEARAQGELLIPLQEADFHIVDFVPIKHHQNVGLCLGFCGAVSDQEGAILWNKGTWSSEARQRPTLALPAVMMRMCVKSHLIQFYGKHVTGFPLVIFDCMSVYLRVVVSGTCTKRSTTFSSSIILYWRQFAAYNLSVAFFEKCLSQACGLLFHCSHSPFPGSSS